MVNDPIADLLTRIRNAQQRSQKEITMPASKMVVAIAEILKQEGFVSAAEVEKNADGTELKIGLKYEDGKPMMGNLKRISKPGLRRYVGYRDIPKVLNGLGINILSTPKGIMTGSQARVEKVGGEYLCNIW